MPPFSRLTRWILSDASESKLRAAANDFADVVREACTRLGLTSAQVGKPLPSPLERIRRQYRYDVLLRTRSAADRMKLLAYLRSEKKSRAKVERMVIDVDPISLL